ncbi:hypothetical protein [Magnetovibrio blakemorei]|uniref:Uncharacterized protein n=1 Tax=Magnetovibrio blakemorei TaxID=28181 RepID=A0A1E5Q2Z3_9PROT|nr:hypothetical protein [Magnetovibrio blakemorei]OEJ63834.1 hypothetical protein BEN30_17180 [Magnetovibrio blakemorei]
MSTTRRLKSYYRLLAALLQARSSFDFALPILPILARLGLAFPIAYLIHKTIQPMTSQSSKYKVLVIEKAVFNEDIMEVLGEMPEVQVFGLKRAVIKCVSLGILPKQICGDDCYITDDPVANRAKLDYRKLLFSIWSYLSLFRSYDAVLTGNWCYWAERELGAVLEHSNIPFIVLHKEGIKPPERSKILRNLFKTQRGQFTGRRVLVYQEDEKNHQVDGGIARDEQVICVGMPRMDRNHKWRRLAAAGKVPSRADRQTVLFLAFLPNNFLPSYSGIESDLAWEELCSGTYRAAIELANENPTYDVIIRPRIQEAPEVEILLNREGPQPENLKIVSEGEASPLIESSWVICGHNTTVLLEALASNKPVVVPHFGESLDPRYEGFNVELGDAVEHAISVEDLKTRIKRHCETPYAINEELSFAVTEALQKWTGNPDGNASERVRKAILHELTLLN